MGVAGGGGARSGPLGPVCDSLPVTQRGSSGLLRSAGFSLQGESLRREGSSGLGVRGGLCCITAQPSLPGIPSLTSSDARVLILGIFSFPECGVSSLQRMCCLSHPLT